MYNHTPHEGIDLDTPTERFHSDQRGLVIPQSQTILDEAFVPDHITAEPGGPDLDQVAAAIDVVVATSKVVAMAIVSVFNQGESSRVTVASGIELVRAGFESWRRHGQPSAAPR